MGAGLGSSGNRPPWVPRASRAWLLGLNLKIPKIALTLLIVNKLRLAFLVFQKWCSAFLIVANVLAFLVVTKVPGHSKLSKNAMQWMRSKAMFSIVKTLPLVF